MGLLNANYMGLYVYETQQTTPYTVYATPASDSTAAAAVESAWDNVTGVQNNDFMIIVKSNGYDVWEGASPEGTANRPLIGTIQGNGATSSGFTAYNNNSLSLLAAATNTSLESSRGIDEVVAKGTQCNSETYTTVGALSWSVTADGLVQDTVAAGNYGASALLDIARDKKYVLVRFILDCDDIDGTEGDENEVQYWGQGIIESVNLAGSFDSTQTYSATIRGYGNLYRWDANGTT